MMQYMNVPKVQIIGILSLFFLLEALQIGLFKALILLIFCVGSTVVSDVILTYLRKKKFFKPFAGVVTGFILTLIIDPSANGLQIFTIGISAMAIKNFVRFSNRHIFNPAASGLLIGWVLFRLNPSWWGASLYKGDASLILNLGLYLLLAAIAFVSTYRLGRRNSFLSYILSYSLLFLLITSSLSIHALIKTIMSPGLLFFSLLMLVEPMTSPVNKKRQIVYGLVIAILSGLFLYVSFNINSNIPDSSIMALLIGNLLFFKFR